MARRRPVETAAREQPTNDVVPECLRAGPCLEVWAPGDHIRTYSAWGRARDLWLEQHGLTVWDNDLIPDALYCGSPWSFVYLAENDLDQLVYILDRRGLPPDWRPAPAPPEWRVKAGHSPGFTYTDHLKRKESRP